ncbi:MAG: FG-GAP-like repeat-containing protein [Blastocatellia bacterium]
MLSINRSGASNFSVFRIINLDFPLQVTTISGLTISNGDVAATGGYGGGIYNYGGSLTLNNCVLTGNKAREGGAFYTSSLPGTLMTITNCAITGNTADVLGGGISYDSGQMTITGSTISGNIAHQTGGGVAATSTALGLTMTNCTISGNTAFGTQRGGGIYHSSGLANANLILTNCTIANNTGSVAGGGGIHNNGAGATVTYKNTLVANNTGPNFVNVGGTLTSQGNNLSSDGTGNLIAAGDKPNTDPKLGPLANNGGPTQTQALLCNSPAIDAGTSSGAPTTDQRGIARPQFAAFDIGAFEYNTINTPPVLGTYPNASVTAGGSITAMPSAPPSDDGTINSLTASAPNFTGAFSVSPTTGVVTVSSAGPIGSYTVTVRAYDNCLAQTTRSFTLTVTGTVCPGVNFSPPAGSPISVGQLPFAVAVADLNLDTKQDLVIPNEGTNNISVLLGNGAGGFASPTNITVGAAPRYVAVGDFNLDGKPDLAVANWQSHDVTVLLGNGTGSFASSANFGVGNAPRFVATNDFNLDGKPDLVTANSGSADLSILLGNGTGGFTGPTNLVVGMSHPAYVAIADLNLDNKLDLAVASAFSNNVSVLLGNGTGGFTGPTHFNVPAGPTSVAVADFNLDGNPDLATANHEGVSNNLSVLLGNGLGGFAAPANLNAGTQPFSVVAGDFNADGKADLAVTNRSSNNVSVLTGNGTGGFASPINFAVGSGPLYLSIGDFNGDGKQDFAVANRDSNNVTVLLNSCIPNTNCPGATITVTTTADTVAVDGGCSLREAIQAANTNTAVNECSAGLPGLDTIYFAIGAGTPTINLTSALPTITEPVVIDGGACQSTRVELNGLGAGTNRTGLTIMAGNSTIKSLVINRFTWHGILLQSSGGNTIQNCFIGTNAAGTTALGNGANGIWIDNSPGNTIGGAATGGGNVISGNNLDGVLIINPGATGNQVLGNFIGTNATGTAALPNLWNGVAVVSANNAIIGGTAASASNLLSGNGHNGLYLAANNTCQVQGNLIGTTANGLAALPNNRGGIRLLETNNNTIGGTSVAARNLISGNTEYGVYLDTSNNNTLQGNFIGTDTTGTVALGNNFDGIYLVTSAGNLIGGSAVGEGNTIAFNGRGVVVATGTGNRLSRNSIFSNTGLGIDLGGGSSVNPNDTGDADTGANNMQNFPVLAFALPNQIQGTLNSTPNTTFTIQFFSNTACDPSGNGEGQIFKGETTVTTNGSGNANINFTPPFLLTVGEFITTTATDPNGNTSEFSACRLVTASAPPTIVGKTVALQAGATATNVAIATVNDDLTPRPGLAVTVVPPVPLGITVTAISAPTAAGIVRATVTADCLAGTGNNNVTLRVTDGNGLTAQAILIVNVIPFYSYQGGIADNFAAPAEAASRRTALNNALPGPWKNFDVITLSRSVGHSFINLPADIIKAELEVRMKPASAASADDTIRLGLTPPNTFAYTRAITNLPGTGGTWVSNLPVTFTLDLSNLPGGGNILPKLVADRLLDVVIRADTTVDYMKLRVWTCPPGLIVGGTPTAHIGAATLTTNPDGSTTISGLNALGMHGYKLNLGQAEGASANLTSSSDLTVIGDSVGVQYTGPPQDGGDEQVLATATFAGNGTNVNYTVSFNVGSANSLYEFRSPMGTLLRSFVAPNNSPQSILAGGGSYLLNAKSYYNSRSNTAKATFVTPATILDSGNITTLGVTEIVVTALLPTANIAFVSSTSVLAHLSGGGTLVSSNQGVMMFGNEFLTAHPLLPGETQTATVAPAGGALTVANIGSSGLAGIRLDLREDLDGKPGSSLMVLEPSTTLANANAAPPGAFMQASVIGAINAIPNQSLGMLKSTKITRPSNPLALASDIYTVTADFGTIPSVTHRVQVYNNGVPVADIPGHTGAVGTTSARPIGFAQRVVAAGGNRPNSKQVVGLPGFIASYPASTVFNISNTNYTGDELRVTAEGSGVTIDSVDAFKLTAADIPEFTIVDAQVTLADNPPTIAAAAVARQAGSPSASATIANVNDIEDAENTLIVKVNNATTATVNGVTVSGISVDSAGVVTANVVAACGATNASFALTVFDSGGSAVSTALDVSVNANEQPLLGYSSPQTVAAGGALTVTPTAGPSDNGSITGIVVQSLGTFTGTLTVNNTTGDVSISNAQPGGTHTITIRATDQCGTIRDASFTLGVGCNSVTVTPPSLPNGFVGTLYTQPLGATGGSMPYTFTLDSGAFPNGLNIVGANLTGNPTTTGVFNFSIKATDNAGCMGTRAYTVAISGTGLQFYPLARPVRLLETRSGQPGCIAPEVPITGDTSLTVLARGTCDGLTIPANAAAVTGNITTVNSGGGYLTIYPSSAAQPFVANSNYAPNQILNNVFTTGLGPGDGAFKIYVTTNTDVVVDITGYYAPPGAGGLFFHPLPAPVRLLESRAGQAVGCFLPGTPLPADQDFLQQGGGTCGIPATALALVGNATTVSPQGGGWLTIFPADATRPLIASGNYLTNQVLNSPFTVGLSPSGQFKVYTVAQTDLVIDVLGYYSADAVDVNGAGLLFSPMTPARLLETRAAQPGCFTPATPIPTAVDTPQAARGVCTIPATAQAIVGNATVVTPAAGGFLTFWPSNAARPFVATSNYLTGDIFNRHFTVGLGADGAFKIFAFTSTHLVIDVSGSFAP